MTTAMAMPWRWASASTALAFVAVILLGGINAVAVRVANTELAPLWDATLRFGIAAAVLMVIVLATRTPLPRGRALAGSVLYGAVGFAGAFGCIHWALVAVPPASVQTILALVPLLTLLLAVGAGLERFRPASLVGGLIAFAGIALIFGDRLGAATPLPPLGVAVAGAACMAGGNVIVKRFPTCHPVAHNAVAMTVGASILLAASMVSAERHALPVDGRTWAAVAYVALAGTVGVFTLFIHVMRRWAASTTSYVMLVMPLVTVVAASTVLGQAISSVFATGGALVLAGVGAGLLGQHGPPRANAASGSPAVSASAQPGCA